MTESLKEPKEAVFGYGETMRVFARILFLVCAACSHLFADERPNILWITAEDMSPNLGCYGDAFADTPHLDRLAALGTRYTNFFAESPMCSPSRATIITGMHNGPLGASQMRSNHRVPDFVRPFTAWLREAGYYCANNSKTDYNLARNAAGDDAEFIREGWDESSGRAHWRGRPEDAPFFCVLNYIDTHQSRISRDPYPTFVAKVQSRLASGRHHDPEKAPLPPHYPDTLVARRTMARYHDCISALDDFVGKTLADLEADGIAEDTIVFFYSDHGAGLPTGKALVSDFGLRCPLIVFFPEKFRHLAATGAGGVSDRLTCFADLAPTVLNLLNLPIPDHMHGTPFLGKELPPAPEFIHGTRDRMDETLETTRWISDGRYLCVCSYRRDGPVDQQSLTSFYNGNGELCEEIRRLASAGKLNRVQQSFWESPRPATRLFDCVEDPWNLHNLADDPSQSERVTRMRQALEAWMLRQRDLGFWLEPELTLAETNAAAYHLARSGPTGYPLERILETAKLEDAEMLVARLADDHPLVRGWAVIGLAALGKDADRGLPDLVALMRDESPSVRIEAAGLVARKGKLAQVESALEVLVKDLDSTNDWTAARAARLLELLGEKARPRVADLRRVLRERSSGFAYKPKGSRPAPPALEFSLLSALANLGVPAATE